MPQCPVCTTDATRKRDGTPYWVCPKCALWFQAPLPPKVFIGEHEHPGEMSDQEKGANEWLAGHLFDNVMRGKPGRTLDIGAQYPYLASRLKARGCRAYAMDGDESIHSYGPPLGVNTVCANFESPNTAPGDNDLITLVNVFEHLYDPLAALRKLRALVADDGRVFLRLPDHSVSGYERDLCETHYKIHPYYHCFASILEALVQLEDVFAVESTAPLDGFGQRDIVLKPINIAPALVVGIIAKNEERDLPNALASVRAVADMIIVADTGSTDGTVKAATENGADIVLTHTADSLFIDGDWKLQHFGRARNKVIDLAEQMCGGDGWYLWLDADDELLSPLVLRRLLYWHQYDVFGGYTEQDGSAWVHYRMWRMHQGIRFAGRVHEYAVIDNFTTRADPSFRFKHDAAPGIGEGSNARNLRLLQLEYDEEPTTRGAFYLAMTHRDGGRPELGLQWFRKRIEMGVGYRDEMLFAYLYASRCACALKDYAAADVLMLDALRIEPSWAEFIMQRAQIAYVQGKHAEAIDIARTAIGKPIPYTQLWREVPQYTDQPPRLISWCHEHLGNWQQALEWGREAQRLVPHDQDWNKRVAQLEARQAPPAQVITRAARPMIGLLRPGAIGDIIMTLNLIPALRDANPDHDIVYFCDKRLGAMDALGPTMHAAGVDLIMDHAQWAAWCQSTGSRLDRAINLVGYPLHEGYPDKPMRQHLLQYFADEMGVKLDGLPALAILRPSLDRVSLPFRAPEPYITVQEEAGWSKYKQWPRSLLAAVDIAMGPLAPQMHFVTISASMGLTLAQSIALFANARMHVGIDSFCNHLTNYFWEHEGHARRVPGVILWGSTQASAAGYAHNINISKGLKCQPCFRENPSMTRHDRGPCINPPRATYADDTPHACMASISQDEVIAAVRSMWDRVSA